MVEKPLTLEYYPAVSNEMLNDAKSKIEANKTKWDAPFFMDVYKYGDLDEFKQILKPFLEDSKLENIIILGTGGSYQTMKGLSLLGKKKIYFIASSRPKELNKVLKKTSPQNSVVIPISRAGNTLDVNSTINLFKDYKMIALSSQGAMYDLVKKLNATIIPVPDLSGRFAASICSVVFVPAILAGIDVIQFQKGLDDAYQSLKNLDSLASNPALCYATFLFGLYNKGYRNVFSMPYSKWLEGVVGLFVQEISESSGKENKGYLGTAQPAPLCQHSVLELILGGSKGHTTPLSWTTLSEPDDIDLKSFDPLLVGQTGLSVINYQADATFQALLEQEVPSAKVCVSTPNEYTLGYTIAFIQTVIYYLCLILDVNWSSNPLVNTGKKICNEAIKNKLNFEARIDSRKKVAAQKFNQFWK